MTPRSRHRRRQGSRARASCSRRAACARRRCAVAELAALAQPRRRQPDVVVVDVRGGQALPPAVAALKRQHPDDARSLLVASSLDPALMLEAMRAGVNECVAEPLHAGRARGRDRRGCWRTSGAGVGGPGVRVRRRQGRRRHDDRRGERGDGAGQGGAGAARCSSTCTWPRRRRGVPRRRAALLGASTRSRTSTASTTRSSRAWSCRRQAGPSTCWPRPTRARRQSIDVQRVRSAGRVRRAALSLRRARRAALRRRGARRARRGVARSSSSPTRSWRPCAAPAAWRPRCASATARERVTVVVNRVDQHAEIGREDVEQVVGARDRCTRCRATTAWRCDALNKGGRWSLDNHNKLAGELPRAARATWPGVPAPRSRQPRIGRPVRPAEADAGRRDRCRSTMAMPEPFARRDRRRRPTSAIRTIRSSRAGSTRSC